MIRQHRPHNPEQSNVFAEHMGYLGFRLTPAHPAESDLAGLAQFCFQPKPFELQAYLLPLKDWLLSLG